MRLITSATASAVGASDRCSPDAKRASHRASFTFNLVMASLRAFPSRTFLESVSARPGLAPAPARWGARLPPPASSAPLAWSWPAVQKPTLRQVAPASDVRRSSVPGAVVAGSLTTNQPTFRLTKDSELQNAPPMTVNTPFQDFPSLAER